MLSSVPWKASQTRRNELSFLIFKSTAARLQLSIILRKLLLLMATRKEFKLRSKENELLLMQLPYYNCKDLVTAHTQFNNLIDANLASRKSLDSFASLYDLGVFQLNSANKSINPDVNLITNLVLSNYYSPQLFRAFSSRKSEFGLSFLHVNIRSLQKNVEDFQHHVLNKLNFNFTFIGVTETRLSEGNTINLIPQLPGYCFEFVQTPLSAGGVRIFINSSFQAL